MDRKIYKANDVITDYNWGSQVQLTDKQIECAENIRKELKGFSYKEALSIFISLKEQLSKIAIIE